jgi:hypothetical protein
MERDMKPDTEVPFGHALEGRHKPSEPMIVWDVERLPTGGVRVSEPYLLKPDGSVASALDGLQ